MVRDAINSGKKDIKDIFRRIRNRDFSGNRGLAIKNSIYQFATNFAFKVGSLIFTIIIARLLMPELFGLYNLALSTLLVFFAFANLGIAPTIVKFASRELGKGNEEKARAYVFYTGKIKILLVIFSSAILLISAKFISDVFYQKPIFWALIAGSLYILFYGLEIFLEYILQASNHFDKILYKEILFQIFRVILVPVAVLISIKSAVSNQGVLFILFLALAFSYLLISILMFFFQIRKIKYIHSKKKELSRSEKKITNRFFFAISATAFSGLFFEYVDKIMLGHFVQAEFIGYYAAAIGLVGTLIALEGFGTALLPIFSQVDKSTLERGLKKSVSAVLLISIATIILTFVLAPVIVNIIYGHDYAPSVIVLRLLSLLLIPVPLATIYSSYFISIGKPKILATFLILSTVLNIILNYVLITSLLSYGGIAAVLGSGVATIISQGFYLTGLILSRKRLMQKVTSDSSLSAVGLS